MTKEICECTHLKTAHTFGAGPCLTSCPCTMYRDDSGPEPPSPLNIYFRFTHPRGPSNHLLNLEIWKGSSILGVWPIDQENAVRMSEEIQSLIYLDEGEEGEREEKENDE